LQTRYAPQVSYAPAAVPHSAGYTSYGAASIPGKLSPATPHRAKVNLIAVLICLFAPCAVFAIVCGALSLATIRGRAPVLTWLAVIAAAAAVAACVYLAGRTVWKRSKGLSVRDPFWYLFLAATMTIAFAASYWLGQLNWRNNMQPYLVMQNLGVRTGVDPASAAGQQLMDVGRVNFVQGSQVDVSHSMGFKSVDEYCVAPIVRGDKAPESSYDLWAIGLNCCSGKQADFRCGDVGNPKALGGLRILREEHRSFYALAVQQAEAAYNIQARYPLFFYWVENPARELQSYKDEAERCCLLGCLCFVAGQLLLVLVGTVLHSKL